MSSVQVKIVKGDFRRVLGICFGTDLKVIRDNPDAYEMVSSFDLFLQNGTPNDICEEVFDLTNNPSRQDERERIYGRFASVSVGDIVVVDGRNYVCDTIGWKELPC